MLAEERRSRILELLAQKSVVGLAELAAFFETSEMTIRRDLDALAERGECQRIRGGAMSAAPAGKSQLRLPFLFFP